MGLIETLRRQQEEKDFNQSQQKKVQKTLEDARQTRLAKERKTAQQLKERSRSCLSASGISIIAKEITELLPDGRIENLTWDDEGNTGPSHLPSELHPGKPYSVGFLISWDKKIKDTEEHYKGIIIEARTTGEIIVRGGPQAISRTKLPPNSSYQDQNAALEKAYKFPYKYSKLIPAESYPDGFGL